MKIFTLCLSLIISSTLIFSQSTTINLNPDKDNTLYQSNTGAFSNGSGDHFFTGTNNSREIRRGVLHFDLSSLPADATIERVELRLNMTRTISGAHNVTVHRLLADWGEGTSVASGQEGGGATAANGDATWIHRFHPDDLWNTPGGDFDQEASAIQSVERTGMYIWQSEGLVADVQAWVDTPSINFGWLMKSTESFNGTAKRFNSREHNSSPPVLRITYNAPIPQFAQLQLIHNAADPSASIVDIYVNGTLAVNNFRFRQATPFLDLPAGEEIMVGVAPPTSTGPEDIIVAIGLTLQPDRTYVAMATGVLFPVLFNNNVNSDISFRIRILSPARTRSVLPGNLDLIAFHGVTDAPPVDFVIPAISTTIFDDLSFGNFSDYIQIPVAFLPGAIPIDMRTSDGNTVISTFLADLTGLGQSAAVVFISGFLDPATNQLGPPLALLAALPNGVVIEFPEVELQFAQAQFIHNAPDPRLETMDIYINGTLAFNDFSFRTATTFQTLPAEQDLTIEIAPGNSTGLGDAIASIQANLEANKVYVAVASGVVDTNAFNNDVNSDIGFTVDILENARIRSVDTTMVDIIAYHGAPDLATFDMVMHQTGNVLVDNLPYGAFSDYISVLPSFLTLRLTPANDNSTTIAGYVADLRALQELSAVIFTSGFLNTNTQRQDLPEFGLYAALLNGSVVTLEAVDITSVREEFDQITSLEVFPNPAGEELNIRAELKSGKLYINLYDLLGQPVLSNEFQTVSGTWSTTLNVNDIPPAPYFLKLVQGDRVGVRSVIIKR